MPFAYMVRCSDGSFYTGYTTDLDRRVAAHNAGKGAKYTRSRRPVVLVYCEELPSKSLAMRREAQLKNLTRAQKEQMLTSIQNSQLV